MPSPAYTAAGRQINTQTARDLSTNAYARFLAQRRGTRQQADLTTDYNRGREDYGLQFNRYRDDRTRSFKDNYDNVASVYGARGLAGAGVASGVQQRGLADYRGEFDRDISRATGDYNQALQRLSQTFNTNLGRSRVDTADELNALRLQAANTRSDRRDALARLRAQRQSEISMTARNLRALRPYLGIA